jgi:thymidylate synthase (FAD)
MYLLLIIDLSPELFASNTTGPFCCKSKCLEGKMSCGCPYSKDIVPEDILKEEFPLCYNGGKYARI